MSTLLHTLEVSLGARSYPIQIGTGLIDDCALLREKVQGRTVVVVANTTTSGLFETRLVKQLSGVAYRIVSVTLPDGEAFKTLEQLDAVFSAMLEAHADRGSVIIALGGGVVGDMAGFAAAVYQRGVDFIQVPTTLLAMVDSSVGGKTAVNHVLGKNMIGAFHQPLLVLADIGTLSSLPRAELSAGLAEVIKHGAIANLDYLAEVETDLPNLLRNEPEALARAVLGSCRIKARVVAADEREQGLRALLNFGHTFGHAIEAAAGYGAWLHGHAVGTGMLMAANLSVRLGCLSKDEEARLRRLILAADLPSMPPVLANEKFIDLMKVDKKASRGIPKFILLRGLGDAFVDTVGEEVLNEVLSAFQPRSGSDA